MNSRRVSSRPARALSPEVVGESDASRLKLMVVCARWNPTITDGMLSSALEALRQRGARPERIKVIRVPGAFELPAAAAMAFTSRACDAVVALAAIVRGETTHHEVLGLSVANALAMLSAQAGRPIGFGLLTCDTMEQARARLGKGAEAAESAVEMANLKRRLRSR